MPDKEKIANELKNSIWIGVTIIITIVLSLSLKDKIQIILKSDLTLGVILICTMFLLIIWLGSWLFFSKKEVDIFSNYLIIDPNVFTLSKTSILYFFPLVLSTVFGLTIGCMLNFPVFVLGMILLLILALIGDSKATKILAKDFFKNKDFKANPTDEKIVKDLVDSINKARLEISSYYFEKHYFIRTPIAIVFLGLSLLSFYNDIHLFSLNDNYFPYLLVIISVFANDLILQFIRHKRDKAIESIEKEFFKTYEKDPSIQLYRELVKKARQ